eukprot:TRINITY_DN3199_c0_g1_i1.p2 TRINITY_DN3199_c0_g1~~TRINITY_DN3199_c0_g1_i1.p2  ORF type:complete len:50 (+),score=2.56 TRINITY_DN3199_c0_g1_i1:205-354(+)
MTLSCVKDTLKEGLEFWLKQQKQHNSRKRRGAMDWFFVKCVAQIIPLCR